MGNDHALKIVGIGKIKLKMYDGTFQTIQEVSHLKDLKKNLLSLGQLDSISCKTHMENEIIKIVKGALILMKAEKIAANMYMLNGEILQDADASVASTISEEESTIK